jgi:hypothetical protein
MKILETLLLSKYIFKYIQGRPHKCSVSKTFGPVGSSQRSSSNTHRKMFKGLQSEKSFIRLNQLGNHLQTHTWGNPFKYWHCSKTFSHKHHHEGQNRSQGENNLLCPRCHKSFAWATTVQSLAQQSM